MAAMAAAKDKNVEAYKMAHVVCIQATSGPTHSETISWAIKTMLLIMATSVPRPRACFSGTVSPLCTRNCNAKKEEVRVR